jgi:chromatin remodeling complex protein RSC6
MAKANSAFMKPLQPSADLAKVTGEKALPRSEVVKKMWVYIKKHGLQDKTNKRMINSDDTLKAIFGGKKQVSMFEMNSLLKKHLK